MEVLQRYEYGGTTLEVALSAAAPTRDEGRLERRAPVRAPGAGRFEIGPLTVEQRSGRLAIAGRVDGGGIAYVYYEVLLGDTSCDRYYGPVMREHVRAVGERQTGGVCRPDWDDPVEVSLEVGLSMRLLTDGVESAFCFSSPEGYTAAAHEVEGLYVPAAGTDALRAVVTFDVSGRVTKIVARQDQGHPSIPRDIAMQRGDTFTPGVQVFTRDGASAGWDVTTGGSNMLTIGERPLHVTTVALLPGEYLAGLIVQDLDGKLTRSYAPFSLDG